MRLWAVIPSRHRQTELRNLVAQLREQDTQVVVVDNGVSLLSEDPGVHVIRDFEDPPNLSRLWNVGLRYVADLESPNEYFVAVLNDDLVIPPSFIENLAIGMMHGGAVAAFPDQHGQGGHLLDHAGPVSLFRRMTGYAFMLRGSAGLFADETLKWWYGDDDLDWRAREAGGVVCVAGVTVQHLHPNGSTTGVLAEQAGRDRQTFVAKWGRAPW